MAQASIQHEASGELFGSIGVNDAGTLMTIAVEDGFGVVSSVQLPVSTSMPQPLAERAATTLNVLVEAVVKWMQDRADKGLLKKR